MSGISGIIKANSVKVKDILSMTSIIRHRGLDDEGYLLIDDQDNIHCAGGIDTPVIVWNSHYAYSPTIKTETLWERTFNLAFGHRRLSILDSSPAGHQPMSLKNGRFWITFNGTIYNYLDIKNELQKIGYQFISGTDTEVVLAAYAEWGAECLNRFVGMWAFAIYDHKLKEIFLARDRYGIKPIYYWFSPEGHFCFASEIKQFTVCRGWESKMNKPRVYDQLIYSFTDHTNETMFAGVYQLPSGSYFVSAIDKIKPVFNGQINYQKWYLLKYQSFKGSFKEAAELFKELFNQSVKEHLNADVPVGTALSGGLDSSSIVCAVNRILRTNGRLELQKTFSSCYVDERYSEKNWMDEVINHTKVDPHFAYPNLEELFSLTSDIIWHQDEPYQSQSAFLAYNLYRLSSENGVKVLLNGQGADEYLGGYGQFTAARYANMLKQFRICRLFVDVKNSRKINPISNLTLFKGIAFSLLPPCVIRNIRKVNSSHDNIKKIINIKWLDSEYMHPLDSIPLGYKSIPEISKHYTFYSTLPKYLRWEDRNSMAHSVEARAPFLDHRLVEFAYNLPDEFLESDGITKRILREAMTGILPEKIKNRKDKKGFITPEELWVKNENPVLFRQKISEAIDMTGGIIKPEALIYFDNIIKGKVKFDYTYWRLIIFNEWVQKFHIKM